MRWMPPPISSESFRQYRSRQNILSRCEDTFLAGGFFSRDFAGKIGMEKFIFSIEKEKFRYLFIEIKHLILKNYFMIFYSFLFFFFFHFDINAIFLWCSQFYRYFENVVILSQNVILGKYCYIFEIISGRCG